LREEIHSPSKLEIIPKLMVLKVYSDCRVIVSQLERNAAFTINAEDLEKNPKWVKTHGLLRSNRLGFVFCTYLMGFFVILQNRIRNRQSVYSDQ